MKIGLGLGLSMRVKVRVMHLSRGKILVVVYYAVLLQQRQVLWGDVKLADQLSVDFLDRFTLAQCTGESFDRGFHSVEVCLLWREDEWGGLTDVLSCALCCLWIFDFEIDEVDEWFVNELTDVAGPSGLGPRRERSHENDEEGTEPDAIDDLRSTDG